MKHFVNIILLLLILTSCQNKKENNGIAKTELKEQVSSPYSNLTLYDNFDNELILDTISKRRESQFSPVYIGQLTDSIELCYKTSKIGHRIEDIDWGKYRSPNATELNIFIDTTKTIGFPMWIWEYYKTPEYRVNKKSYPIFIKNQSSDTLSIGFGDVLPMLTEVQDSISNWEQIERQFIYSCGTGLTEFYLPPNQIAISALRQNYGTNKTKFRVRFRLGDNKIYSNEINGKINN